MTATEIAVHLESISTRLEHLERQMNLVFSEIEDLRERIARLEDPNPPILIFKGRDQK